ncbi:MAG: sigma-70 family RNA polymerase sigma factor [Polyangiaceae bacterium]|nr:sigma-70 family RNA polymerase sigma factor [Polyangiaceae bacterium]
MPMVSPASARLAIHRPADVDEEPRAGCAEDAPSREAAAAVPSFDEIYDEHLAFVWRSLRRLGVGDACLDDAVQEVFLVVHRRLHAFEARSSMKTWLFGIVLRVARSFRRAAQRRPGGEALAAQGDEAVADPRGPAPDEHAEHSEALRTLHELLDEVGEEKREVFVLAELEQLTAPEIAEALGIGLSNVYGRLRAARREFEQALARRRARDAWRAR